MYYIICRAVVEPAFWTGTTTVHNNSNNKRQQRPQPKHSVDAPSVVVTNACYYRHNQHHHRRRDRQRLTRLRLDRVKRCWLNIFILRDITMSVVMILCAFTSRRRLSVSSFQHYHHPGVMCHHHHRSAQRSTALSRYPSTRMIFTTTNTGMMMIQKYGDSMLGNPRSFSPSSYTSTTTAIGMVRSSSSSSTPAAATANKTPRKQRQPRSTNDQLLVVNHTDDLIGSTSSSIPRNYSTTTTTLLSSTTAITTTSDSELPPVVRRPRSKKLTATTITTSNKSQQQRRSKSSSSAATALRNTTTSEEEEVYPSHVDGQPPDPPTIVDDDVDETATTTTSRRPRHKKTSTALKDDDSNHDVIDTTRTTMEGSTQPSSSSSSSSSSSVLVNKPKASTPPYYGPRRSSSSSPSYNNVGSFVTPTTAVPAVHHNEIEKVKDNEPAVTTASTTPTNKHVDGTNNNVGTQLSSASSSPSAQSMGLLNPLDLIEPDPTTGLRRFPYPKALSPSSIKEFQACPQSFFFQYVLGLRQPTNAVLAKGTMCHAALERVFDLDPNERSLVVLQNLFRTAWSEHRLTDVYRSLFELDDDEEETPDEIVEQNEVPQSSTGGTDVAASVENVDRAEERDDKEKEANEVVNVPRRRRDLEREAAWGREGLQLLSNYWKVENAANVVRPNPVQREMWVRAPLSIHRRGTSNPEDGTARGDMTRQLDDSNIIRDATSTSGALAEPLVANDTSASDLESNFNTTKDTFLVRGIIDRLDMVQESHNKSSISLRLIDYKSGKAPDLKYSPAMNAKIQKEAFEQLLIYALLHRETAQRKENSIPIRYLRLFYLTSVKPEEAVYWDYDLGATSEERDAILNPIYTNIVNVWTAICTLLDAQDPTLFTGCTRSFCYCHTCRPRFVPGTVWEPSAKLSQ